MRPPQILPIQSYVDLMTAEDSTGQQRSYLASDSNFRFVQEMQKKDIIVPVVGDFAGNKKR